MAFEHDKQLECSMTCSRHRYKFRLARKPSHVNRSNSDAGRKRRKTQRNRNREMYVCIVGVFYGLTLIETSTKIVTFFIATNSFNLKMSVFAFRCVYHTDHIRFRGAINQQEKTHPPNWWTQQRQQQKNWRKMSQRK